MKKKMEKLKGMNNGELNKKLADLRENIRVLRFKMEGARPKNVKESLALRREIAQILTLLNQQKQNVQQK